MTTITADVSYTINMSYNPSTGLPESLTYPVSTSSYRLKTKFEYGYGVLKKISDFNAPSTVFWQLNAQDERGQPIDEQLGNGAHIISGFDPLTGLIDYRQVGTASPWTNRQNLSFEWDDNGNLKKRIDVNQSNLTEEFFYDALNRLDYSQLNGVKNLDLTLNAIGNITAKTSTTNPAEDAGTYSYHATKKHAVISTSKGWSFGYDANGNMNSYKGNTIAWTSYNLPSTINAAGQSSTFAYGPNRNRWRQVASYPSGTETTIYVGGILEKVTVPSGTAYRHYISAGSASVIYTRWSTGTINTKYVTADHLGSSTVVMDGAGASLVNLSFGSYGARRGSTWTGTPSAGDWTQIANATRDGFTGHEGLDNVNFIHMNGRVYEPVLGRFLSADPTIDGIYASQGPNRFAYVRGNPLSFTDPTGWSTESEKTVVNWLNKNEVPQIEGVDVFGSRFDFARDFGFQQAVWAAGFRQFAVAGDGTLETLTVEGGDIVVTAQRINNSRPSGGPMPVPNTLLPDENHLPCPAASVGTGGEGILIQLAYTEVIGNISHAFVLAIDPSNRAVYASRGGPGSGPGRQVGSAFNDFVARSGPLNDNFPDQMSEVHSVQTVGHIDMPFANVVSYMNSFADASNSNNLNYWGLFQNSNSYAFTLVEGLGFPRPDPPYPAPGHSTNRVDPRLTCKQ